MTSLFISYSRKDIEIARRLTTCFHDQDLDFWIDWEGIPPTVDWWEEIKRGIELAENFLFLLSPDSAASRVCKMEIEHAVMNGKRLIPVVVRDLSGEEAPTELQALNWIFMREKDDFEAGLSRLLTAIRTDYEWVQVHTGLQIKALEWERGGREKSLLLRGKELQTAKFQLADHAYREPYPTVLLREYLAASQQATDRQRQAITGTAITVFFLVAALGAYGWYQAGVARQAQGTAEANLVAAQTARSDAVNQQALADSNARTAVANEQEALRQAQIAHARQLAAQADELRSRDLTLSSLLSIEAYQAFPVVEARASLFASAWETPRWIVSLRGIETNVISLEIFPGQHLLRAGKLFGGDRWDIQDVRDPKATDPDRNNTLDRPDRMLSSCFMHPEYPNPSSAKFGNLLLEYDCAVNTWDGAKTAFLATDRQVWILDNQNNSFAGPLALPDTLGSVTSMAISPDGRSLAFANTDSQVLVFETLPPSGHPVLTIPPGSDPAMIYHLFFSRDKRLLLSVDENQTTIWDISNPRAIFPVDVLATKNGIYPPVAFFDPDASLLATAGCIFQAAADCMEGEVELWNIGTLLPPASQLHPASRYRNSPFVHYLDQETLLAGNCAGQEACFEWEVDQIPSPREWQAAPARLSLLKGMGRLAINANGELAAAAGTCTVQDGLRPTLTETVCQTLDLYSRPAPSQPYRRETSLALQDIHDFALDGTGALLLTISENGSRVWDVTDPRAPRQVPSSSDKHFASNQDSFIGIHDGMAVLHDLYGITLLDISDPTQIASISYWASELTSGGIRILTTAAWSPAVDLVVGVDSGLSLYFIDVSDPQNPVKLAELPSGFADWATFAQIDPTGKTLAVGSRDGTIRLWDISNPATPTLLGDPFEGYRGRLELKNFTFSPDGEQLVWSSTNGLVSTDLSAQALKNYSCLRARRNLTRDEWKKYLPGEAYRATCPQWPTEPDSPANHESMP